jgi:hypothetical protein
MTSIMLQQTGDATSPPPGEDFTLVVLPDTQFYSEDDSGIFEAQTQWIANNIGTRNIVAVAHEGDIVQNAGTADEWEVADAAFDILDPAGVPYSPGVGNHDGAPDGTANYNVYFGESRFSGKSWYGGHYGSDNDNHYVLFSTSGLDFILINLEYDTSPDADVLAWADDLLTTHSDRHGIVVTHYLMGVGAGSPAFGTQGQAIYDALKGNPNLFLMLGGHVHGEGRRTDTLGSNTVYSMVADYQDRDNGGNGWLRILEFSPADNEITVRTYSPTLGTSGTYETDADSEFTLSYDLSGPPPPP